MRLLIGLPLLLLLVLFALSNTAPVRFGLWPSDYTLQLPLSLAVLGASAIAFLAGGAIVWLSELAQRRRARQAEHTVRLLEAQVQDLKARLPQAPPRVTVTVKICGINDPVAFDAALDAGADWVGFNFFPPSPRYVTPARAAELSARSPGGPPRVGLFVDPTPAAIAAVLDTIRLDALQLYGALDLPAMRARFGLPVWQAVGVTSVADLPATSGGADRLLVEAKAPPGATRPGGNAVRFDWSILRGWMPPVAWTLAGGLTVDNVAEAIRISGASAVDVSSGVERTHGVKDPALIRAFIANARRG